MARPASGQVVRNPARGGFSFALRFRASGRRQYVTLGRPEDGWTEAKAERELSVVLRDVDAGTWRPRAPEPAPQAEADPTFHDFASDWFDANRGTWQPTTTADYHWRLTDHLLPFFGGHLLSQITVAEVDRYRESKVRETARRSAAIEAAGTDAKRARVARCRPGLAPASVNKTLTTLGAILEVAVERDQLARNPVRVNPRRRRLRVPKPASVWLDSATQIATLIEAAGQLDVEARQDRGDRRRALVSVLVFAGLRIGEALDLRWRDVDLAGGRLRVARSKTDAGRRTVDLLPVLHDELGDLKARGHIAPEARVFATTPGHRQNPSNVRNRVLTPAVERANALLTERGDVPLPEGLTPHKLRHTYASLLVALGEDPGYVQDQLGHTDPELTMRVYRHAIRRDGGQRERLRELVKGGVWAVNGQWAEQSTDREGFAGDPRAQKSPA